MRGNGPLERQKAARERLQEIWRKNLEKKKAITEKPPKQFEHAEKEERQPPPASTEPSPVSFPKFGNANLVLYKEQSDVAYNPSKALENLINIYLESASTRSMHVVLMWPGASRIMPLMHIFATAEHWSVGNKKGVRGGYFPAKNNTFYGLNHIYVDQARILYWGRELLESTDNKNPKVTVQLREKDTVFFKIGNTTELRPCLNEIFPHFEMLTGNQQWVHYGDELLEHVLAKVRRRIEKKALRNDLEVLGDPKTAPDALFAFGYRLNKPEIRNALNSVKKMGAPGVFIIDVTRPARITKNYNWQGKANIFIEAFMDIFKTDRPGLVVIADDPKVSMKMQEIIKMRAQKSSPSKAIQLHFNPIVCLKNDEGLSGVGESEPESPEPRKFLVSIGDAEVSKVIRQLYKIEKTLSLEDSPSEPIRAAANYLHKLSALPSSLNILDNWLDERRADIRFREQFLWASYRGNLVQFIESGMAGSEKASLIKTRDQADRIVKNYANGTAIALALTREVDTAANSSKHIGIVFMRPMLRTLGERFLAGAEFSQDKRLEDFKDRVRFLIPSQLHEELDKGWANKFIFVGTDDETLRLLVTDNRIPAGSTILLTYRAGIYMRSYLKMVFGIDVFKRFKPRIEMILNQLEQHLSVDERSVLKNDDFVLPSFNFNVASVSSEPDINSSNAWLIDLDDDRTLSRGETSIVYLYDPANEESGSMGFRSVEVKNLKKGDRLFIMSEDLRELVEDFLKQANIPVRQDLRFEDNIRHYHELVMRNLNERFPAPTRKAQVDAIREHINQNHPEIIDLPAAIGRWISLGEAPNIPFEELQPQAPRKKEHFQAFAEALGFDRSQIGWYWYSAIESIRVNRRLDGRYISDIYSKVLFDQESAIVHGGLSRKAITELFEKARDNVHVVMEIHPPTTQTLKDST